MWLWFAAGVYGPEGWVSELPILSVGFRVQALGLGFRVEGFGAMG